MLALASGSAAGSAHAQQHWLVGTWVGRTENVRTRVNDDRTLIVSKVAPDGASASGVFNAGGVKVAAKIAITGDKIRFQSGSGASGAQYDLTRKGNELTGIRTAASGKQTNITLVRQ
ncbi:MAG: hypothetical protein KIT36_03565 [Alphaproteobacteria bacterium]|nr:hypothetical protein [Alphaproteobacteria bacterium]